MKACRNPGLSFPDCAALHPGYLLQNIARLTTSGVGRELRRRFRQPPRGGIHSQASRRGIGRSPLASALQLSGVRGDTRSCMQSMPLHKVNKRLSADP